jgi:hypothetical protein
MDKHWNSDGILYILDAEDGPLQSFSNISVELSYCTTFAVDRLASFSAVKHHPRYILTGISSQDFIPRCITAQS